MTLRDEQEVMFAGPTHDEDVPVERELAVREACNSQHLDLDSYQKNIGTMINHELCRNRAFITGPYRNVECEIR